MAQYVQVGDQYIEFPDGMTPEEMGKAIQANFPEQAPIQPAQQPPAPPQERSMLQAAGDFVTGIPGMIKGVENPQISALPSWREMPESSRFWDWPSTVVAATSMLASNPERAKIVQKQYGLGDNQVISDGQGNFAFQSKEDGKWYGLESGFKAEDIPRAAMTGVLGAGTGMAQGATAAAFGTGKVLSAAIANIGAGLGIELVEKTGGGDVDVPNIVAGGALGAGAEAFGGMVGKAFAKKAAPVAKVADEVVPPVPQVAAVADDVTGAVPTTAAPDPNLSTQEMGQLVRKATGSKKAMDKLVQEANINAADLTDAQGIGLNLPSDVYSDNRRFRAAVGLARSKAASTAEAKWHDEIIQASDTMDKLLGDLGASMVDVEGKARPSIDAASESIKARLDRSMQRLKKGYDQFYKIADDGIGQEAEVTAPNLMATIEKIKSGVGKKGLRTEEKKLYDMLQDSLPKEKVTYSVDPVTGEKIANREVIPSEDPIKYGRLIRERRSIGQAIGSKEGPYALIPQENLKELYGALAQDQRDNLQRAGGDRALKAFDLAQKIFARKQDVGERMLEAFGKQTAKEGGDFIQEGAQETLIGSLAGQKMVSLPGMISKAVKGDSSGIKRMMDLVPKTHRREAIATAIGEAVRSKSANSIVNGGFGFAEFAKTMDGLKRNKTAWNTLNRELGPESMQLLEVLHKNSRRITDARWKVYSTGKANQFLKLEEDEIAQAMQAEKLMEKVLSTAPGRVVTTGAAAGLGGMVAGPGGATLAAASAVPAIQHILSKGGKEAVKNAAEMFESKEWQEAVNKSVRKILTEKDIEPLAKSSAFAKFAKAANIKNPSQFLMSAIRNEDDEQPRD